MPFPDDSPPDGDYAAYLERLSKSGTRDGVNKAPLAPSPGQTSTSKQKERPNAAPAPAATPAPAGKKRSRLPWIVAVLFMLPLLAAVKDMVLDGDPAGFFLLAVALFVLFAIRQSIRDGQNGKPKAPRRRIQDDDYPNTGQ